MEEIQVKKIGKIIKAIDLTEEEKATYKLPAFVSVWNKETVRSKKLLNSHMAESGFLKPIEQKTLRFSLPTKAYVALFEMNWVDTMGLTRSNS
jgi:hypothetical protein